MTAIVKSTNLARPTPGRITGISKQPVPSLEVRAPGPNYGDGSGVLGDFIGDSAHHGGANKAVYAYEREELDYWGSLLNDAFPDGHFGENLTTVGIVLGDLVLGQRVSVGTASLEVSVPRTPCRTFASWLDVQGWTKTFAARGHVGAYFRVITPGVITPGSVLSCGPAPEHGITMGDAFQAAMGSVPQMQRIVEHAALPEMYLERYRRRLG
ncbi:6-N-hydroxylaminopurine resistance protein [Corynebacterium kalinowskii]|uniref:6-N-hydroxylaminopurine resistance protein n=1 Tax=Corynebacterium kalinowskii TaxID=2675216 RepID=A0A6B8VHC5_9CORY|nr:MOSC domain-containing protein [Corynebacterium kalinowskii]QGU01004.1 6-N-hydroxylaminopurine resistance protein [Corynebacterium kalinowskii]